MSDIESMPEIEYRVVLQSAVFEAGSVVHKGEIFATTHPLVVRYPSHFGPLSAVAVEDTSRVPGRYRNNVRPTPEPESDEIERPSANAAGAKWVEYALYVGFQEDELVGLTRAEVIALVDTL